MISSRIMVSALGMALASGMSTAAVLSGPDSAWAYRGPKSTRGHWGARCSCKNSIKNRAASKRAKHARKLHRK